jgi:flagellar biosynthesis chaperone FliJ
VSFIIFKNYYLRKNNPMTENDKKEEELEMLFKKFNDKFNEIEQKFSTLENNLQEYRKEINTPEE